ncbi:hypothetical protein ScPMuIL_013668 [Solemya velum]
MGIAARLGTIQKADLYLTSIRETEDHSYQSHSRKKMQTTKKRECPAKLKVRRVIKFPEYKIIGEPTQRKKRTLSEKLKQEFSQQTEKELLIHLYIAAESDHKNHLLGEMAGFNQPIDKRVICRIKELASSGHRNVASVKIILEDWIHKEISPEAAKSNRRFFPSNNGKLLAFLRQRHMAGITSAPSGSWSMTSPKHAKQTDGISCGIYVIQLAENYLSGKPLLFKWTRSEIVEKRRRIARFLLSESEFRVEDSSRSTLQMDEDHATDNSTQNDPTTDDTTQNDPTEDVENIALELSSVLMECQLFDKRKVYSTFRFNTLKGLDKKSTLHSIFVEYPMLALNYMQSILVKELMIKLFMITQNLQYNVAAEVLERTEIKIR